MPNRDLYEFAYRARSIYDMLAHLAKRDPEHYADKARDAYNLYAWLQRERGQGYDPVDLDEWLRLPPPTDPTS